MAEGGPKNREEDPTSVLGEGDVLPLNEALQKPGEMGFDEALEAIEILDEKRKGKKIKDESSVLGRGEKLPVNKELEKPGAANFDKALDKLVDLKNKRKNPDAGQGETKKL